MRHDARFETAIALLDEISSGAPAEKVLTNWARANRYAGSGDRAAVRDIVFDALRSRKTYQALAGAAGGRTLVLGRVVASGEDADAIFTGQSHAPAPLSDSERALLGATISADAPVYDVPDCLIPELQRSLGADFARCMQALRDRAPVDLRVNLLKSNVEHAARLLVQDGVSSAPLSITANGLRVTSGERKVAQSRAYLDGLVELQDAGSQAIVDALPLDGGPRVLDYCAGGGGKTLAIAAATGGKAQITAYDKSANRLNNLLERARRAGARVSVADTDPVSSGRHFDLVLLDVPCSGTGAWRRNPDAKWKFAPDDLRQLTGMQDAILEATAPLVADGGALAYVTCSLLRTENEDRIAAFLAANPGWVKDMERRWPLGEDSDGFFLCLLRRSG